MLEKTPETVSWTVKRSDQLILKKINPEYSLVGLMLKLKHQYFVHLKSRLIGKDPDVEKNWKQKEKTVLEDKVAGWYHWCNGHALGQALGDGEGQGSLACHSPWGCKESDTTWRLNNNNNNYMMYLRYLRSNKIFENSFHLFLSFDMMTRKY